MRVKLTLSEGLCKVQKDYRYFPGIVLYFSALETELERSRMHWTASPQGPESVFPHMELGGLNDPPYSDPRRHDGFPTAARTR